MKMTQCALTDKEIHKGDIYFIIMKLIRSEDAEFLDESVIMDAINIHFDVLPENFKSLLIDSVKSDLPGEEEFTNEAPTSSISGEVIPVSEFYYSVVKMKALTHTKRNTAEIMASINLKAHELPKNMLMSKKWKVVHDENGKVVEG